MEEAIKRYAMWTAVSDKFASRLHSMEARLERMDKVERPVLERRSWNWKTGA